MARRLVYQKMEPRGSILMGVDPSLANTAALIAPLDWGRDWGKLIRVPLVGYKKTEEWSLERRIDRCVTIGQYLADIAIQHGVEVVYVESYAHSRAEQAHFLGELGFAIRYFLGNAVDRVVEANMGTARSLIMPKKDDRPPGLAGKDLIEHVWKQAGLPLDGVPKAKQEHYADAMTALNLGLSDLGGDAFLV